MHGRLRTTWEERTTSFGVAEKVIKLSWTQTWEGNSITWWVILSMSCLWSYLYCSNNALLSLFDSLTGKISWSCCRIQEEDRLQRCLLDPNVFPWLRQKMPYFGFLLNKKKCFPYCRDLAYWTQASRTNQAPVSSSLPLLVHTIFF